MPALVKSKDVKIQLLISPILTSGDRETIVSVASDESRCEVRQRLADRIVEEAVFFANSPENPSSRSKMLAWMIASERLEIRFAFWSQASEESLFHEKIGIFQFPWGTSVAFTGSANEAISGHSINFESIDVFRSWHVEDHERVEIKSEQFDEAWRGKAPGLEVLRLSPRVMDRIREYAEAVSSDGRPPKSPNKWHHQDEAINEFLQHERGVLEMATGTGKTRTALRIIERLITTKAIDTIVIAADGNDLLNQWYVHLTRHVGQLKRSLAISRHYGAFKEREAFLVDPHCHIFLSSRANLPPALASLTHEQARRTLLIHDEVHRLGSPNNRTELAGLSDHIRYRLGLSATPDREYDAVGTSFIVSHVGKVLFTFGLEDAIHRGILAPFNYFPIHWRPSDEDRAKIHQIRKRIAAREAAGQPVNKADAWTEMAYVYKTSKVKIPLFQNFISQHPMLLERCIIFVETREYGDDILEIVHRMRTDFHTYFADDDSATLKRFARGELECLVTCHRLSEGIDIQSLRTVVLLSSARARLETIQRIGRCLRIDPNNPGKRANIIDLVRLSDSNDPFAEDTADMERQAWLESLSQIVPDGGATQ